MESDISYQEVKLIIKASFISLQSHVTCLYHFFYCKLQKSLQVSTLSHVMSVYTTDKSSLSITQLIYSPKEAFHGRCIAIQGSVWNSNLIRLSASLLWALWHMCLWHVSYGSQGHDGLPYLIKRIKRISIKNAAGFTKCHKRHFHLADAARYDLLTTAKASYLINTRWRSRRVQNLLNHLKI